MAAKNINKEKIAQNPEMINPTNALEYSQRGWVYYNQKEYDLAREDFLTALKDDQNNIDTKYALALTLKLMGKKSEAIQHFQSLLASLDQVDDTVRLAMIKRLTLGHIHQLTQDDWNLGVNE